MTERERFEAWWKKDHSLFDLQKDEAGNYSPIAQAAWEAWQAAQPTIPDEVRDAVRLIESGTLSEYGEKIQEAKIVNWAIQFITEQTQ